MRKLSCDKRGCKRAVYYVEEGCEGIETELCKKHGDIQTLKTDIPHKIKYLKSRIRQITKELKCQNSKEGHTFPPPPPEPKENKDGSLTYNVRTTDTYNFMNGTPHTCTKCGFTYWDPQGVFNMNGNSITNIGDLAIQVDVPKLVFNVPEQTILGGSTIPPAPLPITYTKKDSMGIYSDD